MRGVSQKAEPKNETRRRKLESHQPRRKERKGKLFSTAVEDLLMIFFAGIARFEDVVGFFDNFEIFGPAMNCAGSLRMGAVGMCREGGALVSGFDVGSPSLGIDPEDPVEPCLGEAIRRGNEMLRPGSLMGSLLLLRMMGPLLRRRRGPWLLLMSLMVVVLLIAFSLNVGSNMSTGLVLLFPTLGLLPETPGFGSQTSSFIFFPSQCFGSLLFQGAISFLGKTIGLLPFSKMGHLLFKGPQFRDQLLLPLNVAVVISQRLSWGWDLRWSDGFDGPSPLSRDDGPARLLNKDPPASFQLDDPTDNPDMFAPRDPDELTHQVRHRRW